LAAFATAAGVIGGAIVSVFVIGQPLVIYTNLLQEKVTLGDVTLGLVKAALFGIIVASLGCVRGLQTGNSASAVGAATTSAVVTSIVFLAITDALLAVIVQIIGI
jgi:phospholipid/cholesterol/gamma-HCH transport system permease protein